VAELAGEPDDPVLQHTGIGDAREGECPTRALERRQELATPVQPPRDEQQTGRRAQLRQRRQDQRLVARVERIRPPDHQCLRAAEQRRRREVVEGRGERRGIAVGPQRPDLAAESLAQEAERTLDEERLVTVQQVGGARRNPGERRQGIPLRRAAAQKASTVYR
jgi:hypothetical protein